jgi:two-component system sensor histidine kinase DctS
MPLRLKRYTHVMSMKNPFAMPRPVPDGPGAGWCRCCWCCCSCGPALAAVAGAPDGSNERQEQLIADTLWVEQTLRFELARSEEALATLAPTSPAATDAGPALQARLAQMFKNGHELRRVIWLDAGRAGWPARRSELPCRSSCPRVEGHHGMSRKTRTRYSEP